MIRSVYSLLAMLAVSQAFAGQPGVDAPKRKSGLWQSTMKMSAPAGHSASMTMCTDEKTDDLMAQRGPGGEQERCERQSVRREGNAYVMEAVCKMDGTTVRTRGVFTGDFVSSYRAELRSTYDPPMRGMKESTQVIDGRYLGPCKPGQKPGDIAIEGMGSMNVNEMMRMDPSKMKEMMQADPAKMQEMMRQLQQQMNAGKGAPPK